MPAEGFLFCTHYACESGRVHDGSEADDEWVASHISAQLVHLIAECLHLVAERRYRVAERGRLEAERLHFCDLHLRRIEPWWYVWAVRRRWRVRQRWLWLERPWRAVRLRVRRVLV